HEAPKRRVARGHSVILREQPVDLAQTKRSRRFEPGLDLPLVPRYVEPFGARLDQRSRLHTLRNLVHLVVARRNATSEPELFRQLRIASHRLAIGAGLTRNLSITMARRPAAKHLSNVNHG